MWLVLPIAAALAASSLPTEVPRGVVLTSRVVVLDTVCTDFATQDFEAIESQYEHILLKENNLTFHSTTARCDQSDNAMRGSRKHSSVSISVETIVSSPVSEDILVNTFLEKKQHLAISLKGEEHVFDQTNAIVLPSEHIVGPAMASGRSRRETSKLSWADQLCYQGQRWTAGIGEAPSCQCAGECSIASDKDCVPGFHRGEDGMCVPNECTCGNGTSASALDCSSHELENCEKCDSGYHLKTVGTQLAGEIQVCELNICDCPNGVGLFGTDCDLHGSVQCDSCNQGYRMKGQECVINECSCKNGEDARGFNCVEHKGKGCDVCDEKYLLSAVFSCEKATEILDCDKTVDGSLEDDICFEASLGSGTQIAKIETAIQTLDPRLGLTFPGACAIVGMLNDEVLQKDVASYYVLIGPVETALDTGFISAAFSVELKDMNDYTRVKEAIYPMNTALTGEGDDDSTGGKGLLGFLQDLFKKLLGPAFEALADIGERMTKDDKPRKRILIPFPLLKTKVDTTADFDFCPERTSAHQDTLYKSSLPTDEDQQLNQLKEIVASGVSVDSLRGEFPDDLLDKVGRPSRLERSIRDLSTQLTEEMRRRHARDNGKCSASPEPFKSGTSITDAVSYDFYMSELNSIKVQFDCHCRPAPKSGVDNAFCEARMDSFEDVPTSDANNYKKAFQHPEPWKWDIPLAVDTTLAYVNYGYNKYEERHCQQDSRCERRCGVEIQFNLWGELIVDLGGLVKEWSDGLDAVAKFFAGLIPSKLTVTRSQLVGIPDKSPFGHPGPNFKNYHMNYNKHGFGRYDVSAAESIAAKVYSLTANKAIKAAKSAKAASDKALYVNDLSRMVDHISVYRYMVNQQPKFTTLNPTLVKKARETFGYTDHMFNRHIKVLAKDKYLWGIMSSQFLPFLESHGTKKAGQWQAKLETAGIRLSDFDIPSSVKSVFDAEIKMSLAWKNIGIKGAGAQRRARCETFCDGMFLFEDFQSLLAGHDCFVKTDRTSQTEFEKCRKGQTFKHGNDSFAFPQMDHRAYCRMMFIETDTEMRRTMWEKFIKEASFTTLMSTCAEFMDRRLNVGGSKDMLKVRNDPKESASGTSYGKTPGRLFVFDEPKLMGFANPTFEVSADLYIPVVGTECGSAKIRLVGGYKKKNSNYGKFFDNTAPSGVAKNTAGEHYPRGAYTFCNGHKKTVGNGLNSAQETIGKKIAKLLYPAAMKARLAKSHWALIRTNKNEVKYENKFGEKDEAELSIWRNVMNELLKMWAHTPDVMKEILKLRNYIAQAAKVPKAQWETLTEARRRQIESDFFIVGDNIDECKTLKNCPATAFKQPVKLGAYKFLQESNDRAMKLSKAIEFRRAAPGLYLRAEFPDLTIKQLVCWGYGVDPGLDRPREQATVCNTFIKKELIADLNLFGPLEDLIAWVMEFGAEDISIEYRQKRAPPNGCIPQAKKPIQNKVSAQEWSAWQKELIKCQATPGNDECLASKHKCKWVTEQEAAIDDGMKSVALGCGFMFTIRPVIPSGILKSDLQLLNFPLGCKSTKTNYGGRKKSSRRRARSTDQTSLAKLERSERQGSLAFLPPLVLGWELPSIQSALSSINLGALDSIKPFIFTVLDFILPPSIETALVVATADVSPFTDSEIMPDIPALRGLPVSFIIPKGISVIASLSPKGGCEKDDIVCEFIEQHFGVNAQIVLALSVGLEPSMRVYAGVGGLSLKKYSGCPSDSGVDMARLDVVAIYAEATITPPKQEFGLSVEVSFEMGNPSPDRCDSSLMIEPLTFVGVLYVKNPPLEFGGSLAMIGTVYELFGLDFLHIADLAVGISFVPPSPIPVSFQAEGTIALGRECYEKDELTGAVLEVVKPNRACVKATLALGYDADEPSQNYFMAKLYGFNISTMMKVFAPSSVNIEQYVPPFLLSTGFVGETLFSFSASPQGAVTLTGTRVPGGLALKGRFNFLGYEIAADIRVIPYISINISAEMDPFMFGAPEAPFLKISAAESEFLTNCGSQLNDLTGGESSSGNSSGTPEVVDKPKGPTMRIFAGLAGTQADISRVMASAVLTGNVGSLIPKVDVHVQGEFDAYFGSGGIMLTINHTHYIMCMYATNLFRVPGLKASMQLSAYYGSLENAAFFGNGTIEFSDFATEAMKIPRSILGAAETALNFILQDGGVFHQLVTFITAIDQKLDALKDSDVPLSACLTGVIRKAKDAVESLLGPVFDKANVNDLGELLSLFYNESKKIADTVSSLGDAIDNLDLSAIDDLVEMRISFEFSSGQGETAVALEGNVKFFGVQGSFTVSVSYDMDFGDLVKKIGEAIVAATLKAVDFIMDVVDFFEDAWNEIKKIDLSKQIGQFIKLTWNGVMDLAETVTDGVDSVLEESSEAVTFCSTTLGGVSTAVGHCQRWLGHLNSLPSVKGLDKPINGIKTLANDFSGELEKFKTSIASAQVDLATFKTQMENAVDGLNFPEMAEADLDIDGGLFLVIRMVNGANYRVKLTPGRHQRSLDRSERQSCKNQVIELFELMISYLAPPYVAIRDFLEDRVDEILTPIRPMVKTVQGIVDMFGTGTIRIENPVNVAEANIFVIRDPTDHSKGPVLNLPIGSSDLFGFKGEFVAFAGMELGVDVGFSKTAMAMSMQTNIFNTFATELSVNWAYASQFKLKGQVSLSNVVGGVLNGVKSIIGGIKTILDGVNRATSGPLARIKSGYDFLVNQINFLNKVPMGACVAAAAIGAKNAVDSLLRNIYPNGVTSVSGLLDWIVSSISQVSKSLSDLGVSNPISLAGAFEIAAGNTNSFGMSVSVTVLGKSASISVNLPKSVIDVTNALKDYVMSTFFAFVTYAKSIAEKISNGMESILAALRFSCDSACETGVKALYNSVRNTALGIRSATVGPIRSGASGLSSLASSVKSLASSANSAADSTLNSFNSLKLPDLLGIEGPVNDLVDKGVSALRGLKNKLLLGSIDGIKKIADDIYSKVNSAYNALVFPELRYVTMEVSTSSLKVKLCYTSRTSCFLSLDFSTRRRMARDLDDSDDEEYVVDVQQLPNGTVSTVVLDSEDVFNTTRSRRASCSQQLSSLSNAVFGALAVPYNTVKNSLNTFANQIDAQNNIINPIKDAANTIRAVFKGEVFKHRSCSCPCGFHVKYQPACSPVGASIVGTECAENVCVPWVGCSCVWRRCKSCPSGTGNAEFPWCVCTSFCTDLTVNCASEPRYFSCVLDACVLTG